MEEGKWLMAFVGSSSIRLTPNLELPRCPHCSINLPNLTTVWGGNIITTTNHEGMDKRVWNVYRCMRCGGLVTACALDANGSVEDYYPKSEQVEDELPPKVKAFLEQAIESLHAPSGAIMLAASAVDEMLKQKNYKEGNLKARIDQAAKDHIITEDMAKWAHQVRLDANDQRHAEEETPLPTTEDAKRSVEFARAFGTVLFVLPARVTRGIEASKPKIT